jgi:hypothetical protein
VPGNHIKVLLEVSYYYIKVPWLANLGFIFPVLFIIMKKGKKKYFITDAWPCFPRSLGQEA